MNRKIFFLLLSVFTVQFAFAQLENVRVETYYIADANDATDTIGGMLEEGTVTYRIYIDMLPGSQLLKIYGDENHPLKFNSTAPFFNHLDRGETFGFDIRASRLDEGTVALDSWITLGQATRSFTDGAYFGVPKENDTDGSILGGANNDGGSSELPGGLLNNNDAEMGFALTAADGLILQTEFPDSWVDIDFTNPLSGEDTSIFGSNEVLEFESNFAQLQNEGVSGPTEENEVLVAQLTTKGDLTFEINLEITFEEDGVLKVVKYVGSDDVLEADETFSPLLNFPFTCGCTDPDFLEASTAFACSDNTQCITPVVYGCMDEEACNFDPNANFNIEDLCCYVGYCNDRDISLVCPDLPLFRLRALEETLQIYPNPATKSFSLVADMPMEEPIQMEVFDAVGKLRMSDWFERNDQVYQLSSLESGVYYVRLTIEEGVISKPLFVIK